MVSIPNLRNYSKFVQSFNWNLIYIESFITKWERACKSHSESRRSRTPLTVPILAETFSGRESEATCATHRTVALLSDRVTCSDSLLASTRADVFPLLSSWTLFKINVTNNFNILKPKNNSPLETHNQEFTCAHTFLCSNWIFESKIGTLSLSVNWRNQWNCVKPAGRVSSEQMNWISSNSLMRSGFFTSFSSRFPTVSIGESAIRTESKSFLHCI